MPGLPPTFAATLKDRFHSQVVLASLPPASRAAGEAAPWPVGASFAGLADEDVASIFAAAQRGEVTLSGGRYTREPTLWAFVRDPRIARRR